MEPIVTKRLLLRQFVIGDFESLRDIQSRPEVTRFLYWGPRDDDEVRKGLKLRQSRTSLDGLDSVIEYAVVARESGLLIGDVQIALVSAEYRTGELGFVFHPAHHGLGYAREATTELLRVGFDELGLHRIIGRCDARNTASAGLMGRLGMRREAHFRRNEFVKGEWCDELVYAMLAEEWANRQTR